MLIHRTTEQPHFSVTNVGVHRALLAQEREFKKKMARDVPGNEVPPYIIIET